MSIFGPPFHIHGGIRASGLATPQVVGVWMGARGRAYWQKAPSASPKPPHADLITGSVALEVQQPWSDLLLSGDKVVETRRYPFPPWLLGQRINILQSAAGTPGISAVPDEIWPSDKRFALPGWIVVSDCILYSSPDQWEADAAHHRVPIDDAGAYGWDAERELYGWVIASAGRHEEEDSVVPAMYRVHRSFFAAPTEADVNLAAQSDERRRAAPPVDFAAHGPFEMLAQRMRAADAAQTQQ